MEINIRHTQKRLQTLWRSLHSEYDPRETKEKYPTEENGHGLGVCETEYVNFKWVNGGGLNDNGPHMLIYMNTWSQLIGLFEKD